MAKETHIHYYNDVAPAFIKDVHFIDAFLNDATDIENKSILWIYNNDSPTCDFALMISR